MLKENVVEDEKKGAKGAPTAANFARAKTNSEEKIMTKLCPRGKAAAKRKVQSLPKYAAYASKKECR